ncbi:glycosyltransferase family 2 protein [Salegentibacter salegens]|uniref:Glycosyltransferase involved in cell wall bisynthesis n=1 Tax=Salegentibacter salegens TaxID=143223 RepID=A0A1M7NE99_9FLAO|nr:glycosyltransferase [Salegentibacter salegens]PRX46306.1 glycosyltransferase involved in cell wall biosynthesis [Salegentibacter salegens]SHN01999.1 Glycosyltransferase involved in cell wall bisynthesis [Salegentibacter salegens]
MIQPLISIILPVYNGERYLNVAIESCLSQSYTNLELIIVNDASNDLSLEISKSYANRDSRIRIIDNKENKKLPICLNIGHNEAKGDFITWTSDDNIFHPDALAIMFKKLQKESADLVYCDYLIINKDSEVIGQSRLKPLEFLLFYGVVGACFLYKKEVYLRNRGYRENLFLVEDYDFWLRALKHSDFVRIDIPAFYYYRYHPLSLTERMKSDEFLREKFLKNLRLLYENLFSESSSEEKEKIINYFIDRFITGNSKNIYPIRNKSFFIKLEKHVLHLNGISFFKLKRIIINDCVDTILRNNEHQNLKTLYSLHKVAGKELMRLPIERYLALVKKVIF